MQNPQNERLSVKRSARRPGTTRAEAEASAAPQHHHWTGLVTENAVLVDLPFKLHEFSFE
jgi:hypothetical protein